MADVAAGIGVERFVLDDGWFGGRRDGTSSLGDWVVSDDVWPGGLGPLVDHVRGLGMEFGLWVEPEMVSPDSDLFRAHPDWALAVPGRLPPPWRAQQVLDLTRPEAYAHVRDRLDALLGEYAIGLAGGPALRQAEPPVWLAAGGVTLAGRALGAAGLQMPVLLPEQALLLHLTTG